MATRNDCLQCTWMTSFSSVHICIAFRLLRRGNMKVHALLGHPVWNHCELVSNIDEHLCIIFYVYRKHIDHLHDLAIWKWFKNVYISFDLKCICVWCLDNWSRILSSKFLNTFSMPRLKTLKFRLTLTPLFTATHACLFLSFTICFMICDWGSPSFFCRRMFLYSRDPRFMSLIESPWFVKFSKVIFF